MLMPPWMCSAACPMRLPPSAAQNFAGRDLERVVAALVEVRRGLQHRELDRLVVDEAVGHALPDGLERSDLAVELLAVGRVLRGEAQRLVGDARHERARSRPSCG